ncbi:Ig-like domain-containing protein [Paenibacillus sp. CN-4]|uniref:Ig-like domain-containing protein n=1 Tax=Paenibacillus nanchangensis TaxID=3348343 RepID=UPI00397AD364
MKKKIWQRRIVCAIMASMLLGSAPVPQGHASEAERLAGEVSAELPAQAGEPEHTALAEPASGVSTEPGPFSPSGGKVQKASANREPVTQATYSDNQLKLEETFEAYTVGAKPAGWTIKPPPAGVKVAVAEWEGYEGRLLSFEQLNKTADSYQVTRSVTDVTYRSMLSYKFRTEQSDAVIYLPSPKSGAVTLAKFAIYSGKISYMKKGAGSWTALAPVAAGQWHDIRVALDGQSHTFDVSIDGQRLLTKEPMAEGGPMDAFYTGFYKDAVGRFGIDDIRVSGYTPAVSAHFSQESYELRRGASMPLPLGFVPADATEQNAAWASSDEKVAKVNGVGVVTGVKGGSAVITAKPNEGIPSVTTSVYVYEIPITDITLEPVERPVPAGSRVLLKAVLTPEDNTDTGLKWGTENPAVATVDEYGELTGIAPGTTTVYVTDETGKVRRDIPVTVVGRTVGHELYVSPKGKDTNKGTKSSPFQTIGRAQQEVRRLNADMEADIVVNLRKGTYTLTEPLKFGPEDSGTNGYFITYRSYPGEQAVISGGRTITGWKKYDKERGIYRANVGKLETRQLFVDGVRAVRARSEGGLTNAVKTAAGYTSDDTQLAGWNNIEDMEMSFHDLWTHSRVKIESIAESGGKAQIKLKEPGWSAVANRGLTSATLPVYYENAYELLDQPGEWYYNRQEGMLYYMPRAWEKLSKAEVIAPELEQLATVYGESADKPVRNLNFEGLTFAYTTWMRPSTDWGHSDSQNNHLRYPGTPDELTPAALMLELANTVNFKNNEFTKLGITAVRMQNGVQNSHVQGNRFYDISGSALNVGQPNSSVRDIYHPEDDRLLMKNNDVLNNVIHDIGVDYKSASAVSAGYPVDMDITHNEMYNLPYSGTHIGYGWDKLFDAATKNVKIEHNLVYDLMGMGLRDGGAFYSLGPTGGTPDNKNAVRNNYVRNQMDGNAVLYTDEGSTYWKFERNVIDLKEAPQWHTAMRWAMAYVKTIHDVEFVNNYTTTDGITNNGGENVIFENNKVVPDADWPEEAKQIIASAGLQPEFAQLQEGIVSRWTVDKVKLAVKGKGKAAVTAWNGKDEIQKTKTSEFYYWIADPTIAKVDKKGKLTGLKQGRTKLIISILNGSVLRTLETDVLVGDTLANLQLEGHDGNVAYAREGATLQLHPYGQTLFGEREELDAGTVRYEISDPGVATVSADGKLTAHEAGTATLTMKADYLGAETEGTYEIIVWNTATQNDHPLDEELSDADGWYVSANANPVKQVGEGRITLMAPGGHAIYQNRKYQNELLDFTYKINDVPASTSWYALMLNNQSKEQAYNVGSMYLTVFGTNGIELHRFNNGARTVIYGKIDGLPSIGGGPIPNTVLKYGQEHRIQMGAFQEEAGVRLIFKVDGKEVYNYLDTGEKAIGEAGYFGVISRNTSTEIGLSGGEPGR